VARHLLPTDRRQIIADLVRERGSEIGALMRRQVTG
jgi:hypothetical protein